MAHNPKDFDISGYKIVNVADPINQQDVVTLGYLNRMHNLNPTSNRDEYIRFINNKPITMTSLSQVCTITTNMILHAGKHNYDHSDLAHILLESAICTNFLWLPEQDLKGKYIQVRYGAPVIVKSWQLLLRIKIYQPIKITYRWQISTDGEQWHTSTRILETETKAGFNSGNTHKIVFNNTFQPQDGGYFWRLLIVTGKIPKDELQPWVNMLFMKIK